MTESNQASTNEQVPANATVGSKFSKALALFLPGIFLLGFNIGTGSVTSMAKAGATYGMSLLWTSGQEITPGPRSYDERFQRVHLPIM